MIQQLNVQRAKSGLMLQTVRRPAWHVFQEQLTWIPKHLHRARRARQGLTPALALPSVSLVREAQPIWILTQLLPASHALLAHFRPPQQPSAPCALPVELTQTVHQQRLARHVVLASMHHRAKLRAPGVHQDEVMSTKMLQRPVLLVLWEVTLLVEM